jgi:hypothetical protein
VKLERSNSILLISCCEDNFRQSFSPDRFKHGQPVHLRHLHIEEDDIRALFPDHRDGFFAVIAFADNFEIAIVL